MENEKMRRLGANHSAIRELFEYGKKRKAEIGNENVFDFSIGNPSIPAPEKLREELIRLLKECDPVLLHGYTSAQGDPVARRAIAENVRKRFDFAADPELIYLTAGASASLSVALQAVLTPGDEVILLTPCFPEYWVFAEQTGARVISVPCDRSTFQPDFDALEHAVTERTRAVIVNSPNNPTGAVMTEENICRLARLLETAEEKYRTVIRLIADEPYRELVYDGIRVPYIPSYYRNTIVCYSFSKSLSLPGERIGYVLVSPDDVNAQMLYQAICGAGRALGYVCAPSLFQHMIPAVLELRPDLTTYDANRNLLYRSLTAYGFSAVRPDGAFYLFLRSPEPDAAAFAERAKKEELLLVPGDSFGCSGYVRISYCVQTGQIERALPAFRRLAESYGLTGQEIV